MKTAIVYYSRHHGNTRKLLDAIAEKHEVTLLDVTDAPPKNLSGYDRIGFASGIYYSKFHKSLLKYVEEHLPEGKPVFFLYTCGAQKEGYTDAIAEAARKRGAKILGSYGCLGYDTFGPLRLIGGLAKGHPDGGELAGAVDFYEGL